MNQGYKIIVLKSIYYLLPRFIRNQYKDSFLFYRSLIKKVLNKYQNNRISRYLADEIHFLALVGTPEVLTNPQIQLFKSTNRKSTTSGSTLYSKNGYQKTESLSENVLDIYITILNNISILGLTDALISENMICHQELLTMNGHHDLKCDDIFGNFKPGQQYVILPTSETISFNDKNVLYISLLKEHSINYYHWITENIPRLLLLLQELEKNKTSRQFDYTEIILLIDEGMPSQCIEIINLFIPFKYTIKQIQKGKIYSCPRLLYCTPLWQSLDNTKGLLNPKEFFVDRYAISLVYDAIQNRIPLKQQKPYRKIYLRRKQSQIRSIINMHQVENFMTVNGFEIIETEKMSFKEQVNLFNEAKLVVGASGATFTNILFMQPGTTAINFYPDHPSVNYGIFQPLADVAKVNLIHFLTITENTQNVHDNFLIDCNQLSILIEEVPCNIS